MGPFRRHTQKENGIKWSFAQPFSEITDPTKPDRQKQPWNLERPPKRKNHRRILNSMKKTQTSDRKITKRKMLILVLSLLLWMIGGVHAAEGGKQSRSGIKPPKALNPLEGVEYKPAPEEFSTSCAKCGGKTQEKGHYRAWCRTFWVIT